MGCCGDLLVRFVIVFYYKIIENIIIIMFWFCYCWCIKKLFINLYERSVVWMWFILWWMIVFNLLFIIISCKLYKGF